MAGSANLIQTHNVLRGKLSEDNVIAGTVGTGYNPTYALVGEAAAQIALYINSSDYKMYAELKDKNGNHIMNSNIIDLPLETMVVNGSYDSETKEVVLILDNGNELRFSVADLVRGLVSEEGLATILGDYVEFTDYATDNASGVLKTNFSNSFSVNPSNGVPYCDGKTYEQYESAGNGMFIGKQTLENVITGKQLVNKTYVDEADEAFEEELFGDALINDSGESIILNNTIEKAPLSITLKGNTYQETTSGKNLFDGELELGIYDNSTGLKVNSNSAVRSVNYIKVNPNTTYTVTEGNNKSIYIHEYNTNKSILTLDTNLNTPKTFTTRADTQYITINTRGSENITDITIKIQLEQNNQATSYEEYTGGIASPNPDFPQEIEVVTGLNEVKVEGKNLLNIPDTTLTLNNVTLVSSGGKISISGTASATGNISIPISLTLPAGTYVHSTNRSQIPVSSNMNINGDFNINYESDSKVQTLNEEKTYTRYVVQVVSGITYNLTIEPQLEKGSQATTYETYQGASYPVNLGSIELCKIGTYQDRIYKNNGNWYLHKEVEKVVLDGTGYWGSASEGDTTNGFSIFTTTINNILEKTSKVLYCDMFKYISRNELTSSSINFVLSGSENVVVLNIDRTLLSEETTTGFKNWLNTNQPLLYYPLQTPTDTQITDTTLINQLNALYNATSYDTQTNISQINANLPFILDISTFKNTTKGKIEALEQEDENYEKLSNKVIELSSSSTDTEYPSAKCVYNLIGNIESILETLDIGNGV